jgi:hypothetical protein
MDFYEINLIFFIFYYDLVSSFMKMNLCKYFFLYACFLTFSMIILFRLRGLGKGWISWNISSFEI